MKKIGVRVMTVHVNLNPLLPFDAAVAVTNLKRITKYAEALDIIICIENRLSSVLVEFS